MCRRAGRSPGAMRGYLGGGANESLSEKVQGGLWREHDRRMTSTTDFQS